MRWRWAGNRSPTSMASAVGFVVQARREHRSRSGPRTAARMSASASALRVSLNELLGEIERLARLAGRDQRATRSGPVTPRGPSRAAPGGDRRRACPACSFRFHAHAERPARRSGIGRPTSYRIMEARGSACPPGLWDFIESASPAQLRDRASERERLGSTCPHRLCEERATAGPTRPGAHTFVASAPAKRDSPQPSRRGLDGASGRSRGLVMATYVPRCGDVVWLQFDPQAGHEQAGRRPALVISPSAYN